MGQDHLKKGAVFVKMQSLAAQLAERINFYDFYFPELNNPSEEQRVNLKKTVDYKYKPLM